MQKDTETMSTTESDEHKTEKEQKEQAASDSSQEGQEDQEKEDNLLDYYRDLLEKAQSVAKQSDWSYVSMELDNLGHRWDEGPQYTNTEFEEEGNKLFQEFEKIREDFEKRKEQHYAELEKKKKENP